MRKAIMVLALAVAGFAVAACGSDEDQQAARDATTALTDTAGARETLDEVVETVEGALEDALTRTLREQNGSGISGEVELEPLSQEQVRVTVELRGADDDASYPVHVHPGTCADLDPTPSHPLENVENGESVTTIDASPLELFTGEYAVNVHDADDPSQYVACADIPSPED